MCVLLVFAQWGQLHKIDACCGRALFHSSQNIFCQKIAIGVCDQVNIIIGKRFDSKSIISGEFFFFKTSNEKNHFILLC